MSRTGGTTAASRAPQASEEIAGLAERLRATYATGRTRSEQWRRDQLAGLRRMITEGEDELLDALAADLGKPRYEAWLTDLRGTGREVEHAERNLSRWMSPRKAPVPLLLKPNKAAVEFDPLGVVLIIAPWNYPVHLTIAPLLSALAAGNTVVCKPSEVAPATSAALARLIPRYVDPDAVAVIEGGVPETTALLEQRWDHILYTGNGTVGRIVAEAAAKHLTPVTLELGGKSPVIIDKGANLKLAASRIAFAKWINAGQTCVSTDHVWVHKDLEQEFLDLVVAEVRRRYGADPQRSPDFARIVNTGHTQRLATLLDGAGYDLVTGGVVDVEQRYVAPTVLRGVRRDAAVMEEEIFGPILPVLTFSDVSEAIQAINAGDQPLALYVFAGDEGVQKVLAETSSGGACVNDAMVQLGVNELPFGGVGASGYGAYHGHYGFETFSHRRAVVRRPAWFNDSAVMRPPYSAWKKAIVRRIF